MVGERVDGWMDGRADGQTYWMNGRGSVWLPQDEDAFTYVLNKI